jgi:lysine/ornithine N-monooxygenase
VQRGAVASFLAAVVTEIYLCNVCSCQERLRRNGGARVLTEGPPVDAVILATGYLYDFPFLDEPELGMEFRGRRHVSPLYHLPSHYPIIRTGILN